MQPRSEPFRGRQPVERVGYHTCSAVTCPPPRIPLACQAIFTHLIGLPPSGKRLSTTNAKERATGRKRGLFGVPFCVSSVTELNKRRSMHFHSCIMGGANPTLLSNVAGHRELEELVCDALDSQYSAQAPLDYHAIDVARKVLKAKLVRHSLSEPPDYDAAPDGAFMRGATFAATANGTHEHKATCHCGAQGKCGCRMARPSGHGVDLHKRTRVAEIRPL